MTDGPEAQKPPADTDAAGTPKPRPGATTQALADRAAREAREAAALRRNLLARKQQQRARDE